VGYFRLMPDEQQALRQARSLLLLLLATCRQTLLALDAAANALDDELATTLRTMIERTEREVAEFTVKIDV
jgi:hypothetical protein